MKFYGIMNLCCFIVQLLILLSTAFHLGENSKYASIFNFNQTHDKIVAPVFVSIYFEDIGWILIETLQFLFVLRGLQCMNPGVHYRNCVSLRIKLNFAVVIILQAIALLIFSLVGKSNVTYQILASVFTAALLKLATHELLYKRLKYKDDGRDLVSKIDFCTIHVTFPLMNAWFTYQLIYVCYLSYAAICPLPQPPNLNRI